MTGVPRVLAVDYGSRRIGLAISDPLGSFALPLEMIPNRGDTAAAAAIIERAQARGAARLVVGLPRNMDGSEGASAAAARKFAERLGAAGIPVELWDERLTTRQAEQSLIESGCRREERRELVDMVAAQQLLQSWLDGHGAVQPSGHDEEDRAE